MDDTTSEVLNTDSFAAMLGGEGDNEQPETDSQNADDAQENEETAQEEAEDDAESKDEADAEGDDEAQDEQPETDSADEFLEIDGEKISKDEAKLGYLRQKSYTQNMQNLAREKAEQADFVKSQMETVTQYAKEMAQLNQIDSTLAQYQNVDWQALREQDPLSYSTHLAEFNDMRARRADVVQQIGQKQQTLTAKQQELFATQTKEAAEHMAKVVPGFGKQHLDQMKDFGLKHGFTADELGKIADKRMLEVLYKASAYDKVQAEQKQAVKKVAQLPTRAAKPSPAAKPVAEQRTEKLKNRLAQTGSVKDFAALLGSLS